MSRVLTAFRGQWGLTPDGEFKESPWIIIGGNRVLEYGFGKPPKTLFFKPLEEGVILPGLVNAHVHFEYSLLKNKLSPGAGTLNTMSKFITSEKKFDENVQKECAKEDLYQAYYRGTFYFNEVSQDINFLRFIQFQPAFHGNLFWELRGFRTEEAQHKIKELKEELQNKEHIIPTPHSVYLTAPSLMKKIREVTRGTTLTIHLLESPDEWDLPFERGETYLYLKKQNLYERHREIYFNNILPYLHSIGILSFKKLFLVHLLHTTKREMDFLNTVVPHAAWVLCHRSVEFLGYRRRNWTLLGNSPLQMLIGTDSSALASDVSILDELYAIEKKDIYPMNKLWRAATFEAYDYFEIPRQNVQFYYFAGSKPQLESLVKVQKAVPLIG
ncbi:MAG: hypothetical protein D6767_04845 [Candidatus Hydrogenedentota bacterium]|nr:MAG: hypothetical protein D6767_04845 [Candidatus Hydrogenedentota bacterium]